MATTGSDLPRSEVSDGPCSQLHRPRTTEVMAKADAVGSMG
eukprot:CAMPEP_0184409376 /NCGR_PEP_ID=MMETSP0738-20130409/4042_1 /TAXON_ID=385413 /ORGANISM="Thalassiosira miniscula, Strain CCMP1093" /LENGTH=40 /DNA_ID= /DNA_START= /DNA_END= /DNA_ORIENTATION=